ncbi:hypothetical protein MATL_G00002420 [Megalops atlanticus]|uniref:Uncharacterized protein n=1 Tax=Megalops atlanticus TaxID=7932 RepID=A0A9D3QEL1_MEGAT|nr:hypothetical protein MATL_G00002420 [Megalops atlanticus]
MTPCPLIQQTAERSTTARRLERRTEQRKDPDPSQPVFPLSSRSEDQPRVCQLSACLQLRPYTMGSPGLPARDPGL